MTQTLPHYRNPTSPVAATLPDLHLIELHSHSLDFFYLFQCYFVCWFFYEYFRVHFRVDCNAADRCDVAASLVYLQIRFSLAGGIELKIEFSMFAYVIGGSSVAT